MNHTDQPEGAKPSEEAGKEAVVKALTCIGRINVNYKQIEILNDNNGAPRVSINKTGFEDLQIHISLSHCRDKAIAFTIVTELK